MEDKRKSNGGNSTKSNNPNDKRKNSNKALLNSYIDKDFDYEKLKKLMTKLYNDGLSGDTKSSTLFLNYVLGKPAEFKEIEVTEIKRKIGYGEIDED